MDTILIKDERNWWTDSLFLWQLSMQARFCRHPSNFENCTFQETCTCFLLETGTSNIDLMFSEMARIWRVYHHPDIRIAWKVPHHHRTSCCPRMGREALPESKRILKGNDRCFTTIQPIQLSQTSQSNHPHHPDFLHPMTWQSFEENYHVLDSGSDLDQSTWVLCPNDSVYNLGPIGRPCFFSLHIFGGFLRGQWAFMSEIKSFSTLKGLGG